MNFDELIKKFSKVMEISEDELKEQLAAGVMILSSAGLLFAGKKVAEVVAEKAKELKKKDPTLEDSVKTLLAGMQMIIEKHEYNKQRFSQSQPKAEIKVAPPPPPPPKGPDEKDKGGEK